MKSTKLDQEKEIYSKQEPLLNLRRKLSTQLGFKSNTGECYYLLKKKSQSNSGSIKKVKPCYLCGRPVLDGGDYLKNFFLDKSICSYCFGGMCNSRSNYFSEKSQQKRGLRIKHRTAFEFMKEDQWHFVCLNYLVGALKREIRLSVAGINREEIWKK